MDIKNLKINYIDIQNFKNIDYISQEFWDWNIIWWYNWNWKSSLIDWLLVSIQWNKFFGNWKVAPWSLIKHWENKATLKLIIKWKEVEIIIERIFKKWGMTLEASLNWEKIGQKYLDELLNSLTIDPLKLWQWSIAEQIAEIKATIWLDTSKIDQEIKEQEEQTKETRAFKKQADNVYNDFIAWWIPKKVEEKSMSELLEKRKIFDEKKTLLFNFSNKKSEVENIEIEIKELQEKLVKEKETLNQIKIDWQTINEKIKEAWLTTIEALDEEISQIEENNQESKKYKKYLEQKEFVLNTSKDFEKDEEKLKELRWKRTEIIANSNLPKYMTISDDWILVDNLEFKLLNTARKIEVAIDLILISWSPLRMIRIENWWELDTKTLSIIKEKILKNNFSIFIERPIIDKYDTIIINDWEIVEDKEKFINNQ